MLTNVLSLDGACVFSVKSFFCIFLHIELFQNFKQIIFNLVFE